MFGSLLLFAAAMPLAPNTAPAAEMTRGASLLRGCQAEVRLMALASLDEAAQIDLINGAYCLGYLNGFTASLPLKGASVCTHEESMGALVRSYVSYMERNPSLLDQDKRVGLRRALEESYPCAATR